MTPARHPLALYRGDSYRWRFVLWLDEAMTAPADLTDVAAKAQIRTTAGGTLLAGMPCAIEAPNIINMELLAEDSQGLRTGRSAWDLQLTYAGGDVRTILAGPVAVTADVTDSVADALAGRVVLQPLRVA